MHHHRLAAIMFTDIVGYTALMGSDEKKAFSLLRNNRRIHRKLIKKYEGRFLKEMGDGILASFSSSIDAVQCGVSIQKAAVEIAIPLRIGIHQGDVIFERKDVLGDGVNIASRIQGLAETNGMTISETVYHDIRNKKGLETEFLSERILKGVQGSVGVYKVWCKDFTQLDYSIDTGELIRPAALGKNLIVFGTIILGIIMYAGYYFSQRSSQTLSELGKSIVVLPFANYTGSDTLEYFTAGMHDALIGNIGKIGSLLVKSKTTANAYKNVDKPIPEIASELGVNTIIEGSVLCWGDTVCLQLKMISAFPEEKTLWVQDYYEEKSKIFNLYNRITKEVSNEINVVLTPQEENLLLENKIVNPEAYEAFLRGISFWELGKKPDLEKAMEYFQLARDRDPYFALAHLGIARVYVGYIQHGFMPAKEAGPKRDQALIKAFELDSSLVEVRASMGNLALSHWDLEGAGKEFRKAIEINPNYAFAQAYYGHYLAIMGHPEKGLFHSEKAVQIEPFNTLYQSIHGMALKNARKYNKAIDLLLQLYRKEPDQGVGLPALWAVYHELGMYEEALTIAKRIYTLKGNNVAIESIEKGYREGGYKMAMQRTAEKMIHFSEKTYFPPWQICTLYCRAEMKKEALDWLEKAYAEHDPNILIISIEPLFDFLREEQRFKEILQKMDLPELEF